MRILQTHSDLVNDAGLISIKQVFSNRILVNDVIYEMNEGIFPPYRILGILLKKLKVHRLMEIILTNYYVLAPKVL